MQVSDRISNMLPSATLEMAKKSRELIAEGVDIINLSLGEPDFETPNYVAEGAKKAIDEGFTKYPPVNGYLSLREAIAKKLKRDNNLDYTPNQIVVSTGAKQTLANIFMSIVNPGDEVIVLAPYWVTYIEQIKLFGGVPIVVQSDISTDFKVNIEDVKKAITNKTKALIFSSPCNPSGSVFTKNELEEIALLVKNHPNITIISDEIYELINFESRHESIAQFDYIKPQVAIVNGVSKGFAMTGWRIGYLAAPQWLADACVKAQGQITSGASTISQKAAEVAITESPSEIDYMVKAFKKRKKFVVKNISKIKGFICNNPKGAFYVLPDVSFYFGKSYNSTVIKNSSDLAMFILEKANVSVVTGEAFGSNNTIRISYAIEIDRLNEAINRISNALSLLN